MITDLFILDFAPPAAVAGIGLAAGAAFFIILAAAAFIIFRLLKKSVKMAFRMAVVAVILVIAAIGGMSLYWFGSGSTPRPHPTSTGKR